MTFFSPLESLWQLYHHSEYVFLGYKKGDYYYNNNFFFFLGAQKRPAIKTLFYPFWEPITITYYKFNTFLL